jgi:hypothetical protein
MDETSEEAAMAAATEAMGMGMGMEMAMAMGMVARNDNAVPMPDRCA